MSFACAVLARCHAVISWQPRWLLPFGITWLTLVGVSMGYGWHPLGTVAFWVIAPIILYVLLLWLGIPAACWLLDIFEQIAREWRTAALEAKVTIVTIAFCVVIATVILAKQVIFG